MHSDGHSEAAKCTPIMQKNAGVEHLLRASVLAGLQYYMQFMPQWRVVGGSMNDLIAQSGESMPDHRKRLFLASDLPEGRHRQLSDAEVLLLCWEAFGFRANEMRHLLDRALCMLASTSDFPEKADLNTTIKEVLSLLRRLAR